MIKSPDFISRGISGGVGRSNKGVGHSKMPRLHHHLHAAAAADDGPAAGRQIAFEAAEWPPAARVLLLRLFPRRRSAVAAAAASACWCCWCCGWYHCCCCCHWCQPQAEAQARARRVPLRERSSHRLVRKSHSRRRQAPTHSARACRFTTGPICTSHT